MSTYFVTPSVKLQAHGLKEKQILTDSPKKAVEIYAKEADLKYRKIEKITNKKLKAFNMDTSRLDEFVDFTVSSDSNIPSSGGIYKLLL